jgi:hypothetical protein
MERRYEANRFDMEARDNLAYYAKDKYRARFLFEETCAIRIQRFRRELKKQGIWLQVQRQHYFTLASEAVRRYQRTPFNTETRKNVEKLSMHRLVPKRHPIHAISETIKRENRAVLCFERCMHTYGIRRTLGRKIRETKLKKEERRYIAARTIQCAVRKMLAKMFVMAKYEIFLMQSDAARKIQRYFRVMLKSFKSSVYRAQHLHERKSRRAKEALMRHLPHVVKTFLTLRRLRKTAAATYKEEKEER